MIKYYFWIILSFIAYKESFSQIKTIIPEPLEIQIYSQNFEISKLWECNQFEINGADSIKNLISIFKDFQSNAGSGKHHYKIIWKKTTGLKNNEAYKLHIRPNQAIIEYQSYGGALNGTMSLTQLMLLHKRSEKISTQTIIDSPKYPFRALMLDPARHFLTVKELKQFIRIIALYKYNTLHLHLNDDHGWRIEIKSHPEITEKGSLVKGKPLFYTQKDIKEIIQYAQQHHVDILPEIDIPGHNTSLLVAHPELACKPSQFKLWTDAGVSEDILCAGNEKTYTILEDILSEVAQLFPYQRFHLGGDEAPLKRWEKCPKCIAKMQQMHFKTQQELFSYFLIRNEQVLKKFNKQSMFWYELDIPKYPENSVCYFWRYGKSKEVIEKLGAQKTNLIAASGEYSYFDYPQSPKDRPNADWMPVSTFKDITEFEPTWHLKAPISSSILGVEATIWGEYLPHIDAINFMTFPRALAYAEAGWCTPENRKKIEDFKLILPEHLKYLGTLGINYRSIFDLYHK